MYRTIKLNKGYWNKRFPSLKFGTPDPLGVFSEDREQFSKAMKAFMINGVNKNTKAGRHRETQAYLASQFRNMVHQPVIVDIGASDGVTSLELMRVINGYFKKYYVTDYNIKCEFVIHKGRAYFFNRDEQCFLVASKKFVYYPVDKWLFNFLFGSTIRKIRTGNRGELLLINKDLQSESKTDNRVEIFSYNVFQPWNREKADVMIVGNLLHEVYFTRQEIKEGLANCYEGMVDNGLLVMIRNTVTESGVDIEKSSVYRKNVASRRFDKVFEINGGVEINDFLLSLNFSKKPGKLSVV